MNIYISIIIPVYNAEKYLRQCLNSIVFQSFKNYELLLVDDGSTDSSLSICKEYEQNFSQVKVIEQVNQGASNARNKGLSVAQGKYIMFIDSDDWIEADSLQLLYEESLDNVPLLFHGMRCVMGGNVVSYSFEQKQSMSVQEYYAILYLTMENNMHLYCFGYPWNKLFRRDIIENNFIRFDESLKVKEDEVFTNQYCCYVENVKIISATIYNYRISFGSSLSFAKRMPSEYEYMADKLRETNILLRNNDIQKYQSQEYIYNLSKGITAAIRQQNSREAKRLAHKCAKKMKDMHLSYNSFTRVHFKDKIRYRYANGLWIYMISKFFDRFYTI